MKSIYTDFNWKNAVKKRRRYTPQMYFDLVLFIEEQFESDYSLISNLEKLEQIIYNELKFANWPSKFVQRIINDFMSHDDDKMNDVLHDDTDYDLFYQFEYIDDDDEEYSYHGSSRHLHNNKQFSFA